MIQANELRENIVLNIFNPEKVGFNPVVIDKPRLIALLTGDETTYWPIPLTPEILEKCGFDKEPNKIDIYSKERVRLFLGARGQCLCYLIEEDTTTGHYIPNQIEYLHQLQNLYFALTGEELQANL